MSTETPHNNNSKNIVDILVIFGICLIIFLIWKSRPFEISFFEYIALFKKSLYFPHYNIFGTRDIINVNVLVLFYEFLLLTMLIGTTYFTFFTDRNINRRIFSLSQVVTTIGITGLLLLASVQQIQRFEHFMSEKNKVNGLSTDEKITSIFGMKYQFSNFCQKMLNEPHRGELIFDPDFASDRRIFYKQLMSYYLYPNISIRFDNQSPKNYLVLHSNKNASDQVPENYKVILTAENSNYILAVRKK